MRKRGAQCKGAPARGTGRPRWREIARGTRCRLRDVDFLRAASMGLHGAASLSTPTSIENCTSAAAWRTSYAATMSTASSYATPWMAAREGWQQRLTHEMAHWKPQMCALRVSVLRPGQGRRCGGSGCRLLRAHGVWCECIVVQWLELLEWTKRQKDSGMRCIIVRMVRKDDGWKGRRNVRSRPVVNT